MIIGIDFSGAEDAGSKIWIAQCSVAGSKLEVRSCDNATQLLGTRSGRAIVLPALADYIASSTNSVFGMDFPFGVPSETMDQQNWMDFVRLFPQSYITPDMFQSELFRLAGNRELRRQTDCDAHTPMSPYNLRLYRQTYFGIHQILNPLVMNGRAVVAPMQAIRAGLPTIVEICPASTLRAIGIQMHYKGRDELAGRNRSEMVEQLRSQRGVCIEEELSRRIVAEPNGDALDSVVAAFAVSRNRDKLFTIDLSSRNLLEGFVFV